MVDVVPSGFWIVIVVVPSGFCMAVGVVSGAADDVYVELGFCMAVGVGVPVAAGALVGGGEAFDVEVMMVAMGLGGVPSGL